MITYTSAKYSFPKLARLNNPGQFSYVFKNKFIRINSEYFQLIACKNILVTNRLGLIIPKKNIKLAVNRNILKRHCREIFRNNIRCQEGNIDIIVRSNKVIKGKIDKYLVKQDLSNLFSKLENKFIRC